MTQYTHHRAEGSPLADIEELFWAMKAEWSTEATLGSIVTAGTQTCRGRVAGGCEWFRRVTGSRFLQDGFSLRAVTQQPKSFVEGASSPPVSPVMYFESRPPANLSKSPGSLKGGRGSAWKQFISPTPQVPPTTQTSSLAALVVYPRLVCSFFLCFELLLNLALMPRRVSFRCSVV